MTHFSLILNLLTHYFHKILDPIGSKFVSRAEPGYRIFDEVPPPGCYACMYVYFICKSVNIYIILHMTIFLVSLLILFILFGMFFVLIDDYTLCFTGSPCCNFSYYNYISK